MFYIPFIRTMRMQSEEFFIRTLTDGSSEEVPFEKVLAYLPNGNSKWYVYGLEPVCSLFNGIELGRHLKSTQQTWNTLFFM